MDPFTGIEGLTLLNQGLDIMLLYSERLPRCTDMSASLQIIQLALPTLENLSYKYSKDLVFPFQDGVKLKQGISLGRH